MGAQPTRRILSAVHHSVTPELLLKRTAALSLFQQTSERHLRILQDAAIGADSVRKRHAYSH